MKTLFFFIFVVIFYPIDFYEKPGDECEAKKKFEGAEFLNTLSIRDTTGMYSYRLMSSEGKLQFFYLKSPVNPMIRFNYEKDSRIVKSKGDLLEVVIISSDQSKSFFFIKGELIDIASKGFTDEYFRVKFYNDNEYIFCFGKGPDYKYAVFFRNKMSFCN